MYFDNLTDSFTLRSAHDEVTVVDAFKRSRLVVIADLLDLYSWPTFTPRVKNVCQYQRSMTMYPTGILLETPNLIFLSHCEIPVSVSLSFNWIIRMQPLYSHAIKTLKNWAGSTWMIALGGQHCHGVAIYYSFSPSQVCIPAAKLRLIAIIRYIQLFEIDRGWQSVRSKPTVPWRWIVRTSSINMDQFLNTSS